MGSPDAIGGREATKGLNRIGDLTFGTLGKRKVAFSERQQRIFELNDPAAYLWRHLSEGVEPEAIMAEMTGSGLPREIALDHVSRTLDKWRQLGLEVPAGIVRPSETGDARLPVQTQMITVGGLRISLQFPNASVARVVKPVFQHLEQTEATPDATIGVVARGARFSIVGAANRSALCSEREIMPALKAELTKVVLERSAYAVALHTACLVRNGRLLLVGGAGGAGKSTISAALAYAGFWFGGDDVALQDVAGNTTGVAFPATLRPGAWKLLDKLAPELRKAPIFRHPDGTRVKYLTPASWAMAKPLSASWLVILRRRSVMATKLAPIDPLVAMRHLLAGAFAPGQRLTVGGFSALASTANRARCYELTYSGLEGAVELLTGVCR